MSQTVVIGGSSYVIPDVGERSWGQNVTDALGAIASALASAGVGGVSLQLINTTPVSVVSAKTYLVDTTAARQLNLPAPSANAFFTVRDISNLAFTNNITIHRAGSESIDGVAADMVLSVSGGNWTFVCDGTNWYSLRDNEKYLRALTDAGGWSPTFLAPTVGVSGQDCSISVAGKDVRSMFPVGARVRLAQSSVTKYFFVKSTSFSTNTTINMLSTSTNTLGAGAIDSGSVYVSLMDMPTGFPTDFDWTFTATGWSSTTYKVMRFWIRGSTIFIGYRVSGTSNGATVVLTGCPVTADTDGTFYGNRVGFAYDGGSPIDTPIAVPNNSTRDIQIYKNSATGAWTASGTKTCEGTIWYKFVG